jgi:hypothetical protein
VRKAPEPSPVEEVPQGSGASVVDGEGVDGQEAGAGEEAGGGAHRCTRTAVGGRGGPGPARGARRSPRSPHGRAATRSARLRRGAVSPSTPPPPPHPTRRVSASRRPMLAGAKVSWAGCWPGSPSASISASTAARSSEVMGREVSPPVTTAISIGMSMRPTAAAASGPGQAARPRFHLHVRRRLRGVRSYPRPMTENEIKLKAVAHSLHCAAGRNGLCLGPAWRGDPEAFPCARPTRTRVTSACPC